MGSDEEVGCEGNVRAFVIDNANPKLKLYNRPFILAVSIFCIAILVNLAFYFGMMACQRLEHSESNTDKLTRFIQNNAKCVHQTAYMTLEDSTIKWKACVWPVDHGVPSCSGGGIDRATARCLNTYRERGDGIFLADYEECPDQLTTIGAALGYYGFIELVVTVALVSLLRSAGVISAGDESYAKQIVRQWVKELLEQKDTGKEGTGKEEAEEAGVEVA